MMGRLHGPAYPSNFSDARIECDRGLKLVEQQPARTARGRSVPYIDIPLPPSDNMPHDGEFSGIVKATQPR